MTDSDNPCLTCPDTCCGIPGKFNLRLSKDEYGKHFKEWEQDLLVKEENKVVTIFSKQGKVCPNLDKKGCRIYSERPIDCRLYPYQMLPLYETKNKAKFLLFIMPQCVENKTFMMPEAQARALVEEFGRKVYGNKKIIVQVFEDRFFVKIKNKIETLFIKFCQKLRIDL